MTDSFANIVINIFSMKLLSVKSVPPNECPNCHVYVSPFFLFESKEHTVDNKKVVLSIWDCTNQKCQKPFFAEHLILHDDVLFNRYLSGSIKEAEWPEFISSLPDAQNIEFKSRFLEIYRQAQIAEHTGLFELAGLAYRKAFEFLIKDWLILNNQTDNVRISKMFLTNVIADYLDGDIKNFSERLIWLCNDHAHYTAKFSEYDLKSINKLFRMLILELEREVRKKEIMLINHRN